MCVQRSSCAGSGLQVWDMSELAEDDRLEEGGGRRLKREALFRCAVSAIVQPL